MALALPEIRVDVLAELATARGLVAPFFAVSDVVTKGGIPPEIRQSVLLWVGCIAGALEENEYREKLAAAGFESIDVEPTRIYSARDALSFLLDKGVDVESFGTQMDGKFMSAFIRAHKPA